MPMPPLLRHTIRLRHDAVAFITPLLLPLPQMSVCVPYGRRREAFSAAYAAA